MYIWLFDRVQRLALQRRYRAILLDKFSIFVPKTCWKFQALGIAFPMIRFDLRKSFRKRDALDSFSQSPVRPVWCVLSYIRSIPRASRLTALTRTLRSARARAHVRALRIRIYKRSRSDNPHVFGRYLPFVEHLYQRFFKRFRRLSHMECLRVSNEMANRIFGTVGKSCPISPLDSTARSR